MNAGYGMAVLTTVPSSLNLPGVGTASALQLSTTHNVWLCGSAGETLVLQESKLLAVISTAAIHFT